MAKRRDSQWREVEEYRSLLEAPTRFESGFTLRTIVGVIFISLIMTPGEMYLGLVTGGGVGAAAQWVTVILFLEISKRSFTSLRRQEVYLLVYAASALVVREEGAFLDLLWRQYFVRSAEAAQFGIARIVPWWWSPGPESEAVVQRTFFHRDWLVPILLLVLGTVVGRIAWFTSGYVLFRLTSDIERLPYPTAPMSALSAMALAEESGDEAETWKWPIFSVGGAIGLGFGIVYVGIPSLTDLLFNKTVQVIPIPFADLTPYVGNVLKATPLGVTLHLGPILAGMLMPFWAVVGSFAGVLVHTLASPILHAYGYLPRWEPGMDTIRTQIVTGIDFWRAFGIGVTLAVTAISLYQVAASTFRARAQTRGRGEGPDPGGGGQGADICSHPGCHRQARVRGLCPEHLGRGDFRIWVCVALFSLAALYPIVLAKSLFPTLMSTGLLLAFFGIAFFYAPLISLVSARLNGLIGQDVAIPFVNETMIFLSGYRGIDIWFVPFPTQNYGTNAQAFRVVELTGMRFTSLLQAELFMLPIILVMSLVYWTFLWSLAPIPSESYPYAQKMWPLRAFDQALFLSSTMYSRMWEPGEQADGRGTVPAGETVWSPSNLQHGHWWYWRVRQTTDLDIPDPEKRRYGPWSRTGCIFVDLGASAVDPGEPPAACGSLGAAAHGEVPQPLAPVDETVVNTLTPHFRARSVDVAGTAALYFEVDRSPDFDGPFLQRSSDRPLLFEVLWRDLRHTGNRRDDDGDGRVDEEVVNDIDDDGDGRIDEDTRHPLDGRKWPIVAGGAVFTLGAYSVLSFFGLPIFLIWGYVQSVTGIPHELFPQILGALIARAYFWKRYGRQQWRQYAMVLTVGFGVGMSLVGMACAALAMISKAVSSLTY